MKELSIEEKARAYDEAFERVKELLSRCTGNRDRRTEVYRVEDIETIFPELKESDDERIRKEIVRFIQMEVEDEIVGNKWLAWLEKQGGLNPYSGVSFKYNGHTWGMCARDNGVDILLDKQLYKHLDTQNKQKSDNTYCQENCKGFQETGKCFADGDCKAKRKAKSIYEVKPKFKVGDWICNDMCDVHIASIENGMYYFDEGDGLSIVFVNEHYHLWTIQDAKDGDVLAVEPIIDYPSPFIAIYKERGLDFFNSHCFISCSGKFYKGTTGHSIRLIHPATKEQRDLLFTKMKESSYEWDAEKKELKKITNVFEECKIVHVEHGKYYYCIKDYYAGGNKRASKGDVVQALNGMNMMALGVKANEYFLPVNTIKQISAWSEEDERICQCLIRDQEKDLDEVRNDKYGHSEIISDLKEMYRERIDWLKSLKQRIGG